MTSKGALCMGQRLYQPEGQLTAPEYSLAGHEHRPLPVMGSRGSPDFFFSSSWDRIKQTRLMVLMPFRKGMPSLRMGENRATC